TRPRCSAYIKTGLHFLMKSAALADTDFSHFDVVAIKREREYDDYGDGGARPTLIVKFEDAPRSAAQAPAPAPPASWGPAAPPSAHGYADGGAVLAPNRRPTDWTPLRALFTAVEDAPVTLPIEASQRASMRAMSAVTPFDVRAAR